MTNQLAINILLDAGVKSVAVLAVAGVVVAGLKRRSAAARHLVCFLAVVSLPLLPLLSWTLPGWRVLPGWLDFREAKPVALEQQTKTILPAETSVEISPTPRRIETAIPATAEITPPELDLNTTAQIVATPNPPPVRARINFWRAGLLAWLAGVLLALTPVVLGVFSLHRLARRSRREKAASWLGLLGQLLTRLGLKRRVVLLKTAQRRMPMTWGVLHPKVLLPEESNQWPEDRRSVVLLHELAHAQRCDYLTHLITRLVCALYWFNPLVWLAARWMIAERERACDDIVLRHGAEPADYAEQVLEISAGLSLGWLAGYNGVAMARASNLEGRLRAILDRHRNRAAVTRAAVIAAILLLTVIIVPVAMMKAASSETKSPATNATLVATNSNQIQITPSIVTNADGTLTITVQVIDVEARQPIPEFTVTPGSGLAPDMFLWRPEETIRRTNGVFRITQNLADALKIEAPDYMPEMLYEHRMLTNELIELHRGEFVTGRVVGLNGQPVAGAQVALHVAGTIVPVNGTNLGSGRSRPTRFQDSPVVTTDARGEFKFPVGPGMNALIASGEEGFGSVKLGHHESSKTIQLEPWGKVVGTLRWGEGPLAGKSVSIGVSGYQEGGWMFHASAISDAEGHFLWDRVPPGGAQTYYDAPGLWISRQFSNSPGSTFNSEMTIPGEVWTNRTPRIGEQIAWGPETNGLQLGISSDDLSEPRAGGGKVTVNFWLRNNRPVTIAATNYVANWTPMLIDVEGKPVAIWSEWPFVLMRQSPDSGGAAPMGSRVTLEAGQSLRVGAGTVELPEIRAGRYLFRNSFEAHISSGEIPIQIVSKRTAELRGSARTVANAASSETKSPATDATFVATNSNQIQITPSFVVTNADGTRTITGHVVDAQSRQPISKFTVTPGFPAAFDILRWESEKSRNGSNGNYTTSIRGDGYPTFLLLEAPGYAPEMLSVWTNTVLNFELHKGERVDGTILDPAGQPVANASVIFRVKYGRPILDVSQFYNPFWTNYHPPILHRSPITTSDGNGNFSLPATAGAISFWAVHERGFAEQSFATLPLQSNTVIRLQPWARIEGRLLRDGRPLTAEPVSINLKDDTLQNFRLADTSSQHITYKANTDDSGHFVFEHVPPGIFYLAGRWVVEAAAGETTVVELDTTKPDAESSGNMFERLMIPPNGSDRRYLDLDTDNFVTNAPPGDVMLLADESDLRVGHGLDMVTLSVVSNRWNASATEIAAELAKLAPNAQVRLGGSDLPQTWFFKTREGSLGVLQIVPQMTLPRTALMRWKLVKAAVNTNSNQPKPTPVQSANSNQRLVTSAATQIPPLERKVSLSAQQMPLKDALAEVCRQAGVELDLDREAFEFVGLTIDRPVTAIIVDEPLESAVATILDRLPWDYHIDQSLAGEKLLVSGYQIFQERIRRALPDWLKPLYHNGLVADLDDDHNVISIGVGGNADDEFLAKLTTLPKLREVDIEGTRVITPAGLAHLGELPALEKLHLYMVNGITGAGLGDDALRAIASNRTLRDLDIGECSVTDDGARVLEGMTQLTALSLAGNRLTDVALKSLSGLTNLQHLNLSSSPWIDSRMQFTVEGVKQLSRLTELRELSVVGLSISSNILFLPHLQAARPPFKNQFETDEILDATGWGEAVDGLQVRLRAPEPTVRAGKIPRLFVDLANVGSRELQCINNNYGWQLEVDGIPYVADGGGAILDLLPGRPWVNLPLVLNVAWVTADAGELIGRFGGGGVFYSAGFQRKPLRLSPGKHTLRLTVVGLPKFAGGGGQVQATSKPVTIEVLAQDDSGSGQPKGTLPPDTRGVPAQLQASQSPLPIDSVYFSGRAVDDTTGQAVGSTTLQFGLEDSGKPGEVIWEELREESLPDLRSKASTNEPRDAGRFSGESFKEGKIWARLLTDGYLPETLTPNPVLAPDRRTNLVVRLKRGGDFHGTVSDFNGKPMPGLRVYLADKLKYFRVSNGVADRFPSSSRTTTDSDGRFTLSGGNGIEQRIVVASDDGHMFGVVAKTRPGRDIEVSLPQPATLILRYDIPDDLPEAVCDLGFRSQNLDQAMWKDISFGLRSVVTNRGEIILTNLTPGNYELLRDKTLHVGKGRRFQFLDDTNLVLKAGETQRVDIVRPVGQTVRGQVTGIEAAGALGAYLYACIGEITNSPISSWNPGPLIDLGTCGVDGGFQMARFPPGKYSIVAMAYKEPDVYNHSLDADFIGVGNVTVSADMPPTPVKIELHTRKVR